MAIQCILISHLIEVPMSKCFRGYVSRTKQVEKKVVKLSSCKHFPSRCSYRHKMLARSQVYRGVFMQVAPGPTSA